MTAMVRCIVCAMNATRRKAPSVFPGVTSPAVGAVPSSARSATSVASNAVRACASTNPTGGRADERGEVRACTPAILGSAGEEGVTYT